MAITPATGWPLARASSMTCSSLFKAPRSLNEAVNCRFSNFKYTCAPVKRDSVSEYRQGVR